MMSYLKVYADFERATEALTEEEKGALLLAMLRYACGGEDHMETLGGGARILFPRFRMDIDHEEEIYLAKVNSGRKGGIAKRKTVESRLTEAKGSRRKQAKAKPAFQEHEQEQEQDQEEEQEQEHESAPVITLPLNDGSEFGILQEDVEEYASLYPAVDVLQELRAMRGWCLSNETKRKTRSGVRRFINSWMARAQDRGGPAGGIPARNAYRNENPYLAMTCEGEVV